jgi:hypothetical protein
LGRLKRHCGGGGRRWNAGGWLGPDVNPHLQKSPVRADMESDPMNETAEVRLTLTLGPICGLGDAGIEARYPLWDSIAATESFPPGAGALGANYVASVRKGISRASEVRLVENELTEALQMLAAAWPFSGGSYLTIETREVICSPCFESNANELEREMLARSGLTKIVSPSSTPLGWSATYSQAPLSVAARIASSMHTCFQTRMLLHYHQRAVIERNHPAGPDGASWFISLYKVRDFLAAIYGNGKKASAKEARSALGIPKPQWDDFGDILNHNDLRHAEISGTAPPISATAQDKLYRTALCWVASYLRTKGLPAIG